MTVVDVQSDKFTPKNSHVLEYGVSPLHAWIRFFEFALKVSYRIGIDKWQVRGWSDKYLASKRKTKILEKWRFISQHNLLLARYT